MQPSRYLSQWLSKNIDEEPHLFTLQDLRALCPSLSDSAFKTLLSRAVSSKLLMRVCRSVYLYKKKPPTDGLLLFHAASLLRPNDFNYISLETVLSDVGVISQIPLNWISIMSSGRSSIISCGRYGTIEFIHTSQKPTDLIEQLIYDHPCGLWRAHVTLAIRDMKATHRDSGLIDRDIANEFI